MLSSFLGRLFEHVANRPSHAALVTSTHTLNYQELLCRVSACLEHLTMRGVDSNAVVGLSLDDEIDHLVATLSIMASGAGQITLATHETPTLRAHLAERVQATHVLSKSSAYQISGAGFINFPILKPSLNIVPKPTFNCEATLFLKTSGTTGNLNIVAFKESQIATQADRHSDYSGERLLRLASIEYNNSKRHRLYCIWNGGTNVFRPPEAGNIIDFTLQNAVTCLDISRMHASDIAASDNAHKLKEIKLRTGGSAVPFETRQKIQCAVTRKLYVRYAATECGGISMANPEEHDADETVGHPLNGVEVQIVDPTDQPLPTGSLGEIRLRAPGMALEYHNAPAVSSERFRDKWFYPGDVGYFRCDGRLVVQGRKDDMIILNGINIFPAEIERVLEAHPAVRVAAALSIPSRVHGQIPVAAVELEENIAVTATELQLYAKQHLALRSPRQIIIMKNLPRNPQGKILRREIRLSFLYDRNQA